MLFGLRLVKFCFACRLDSHILSLVLLNDICLDECCAKIVLISDGIHQCCLLVVVRLHLYVVDRGFQWNMIACIPALLINVNEVDV